jgi:undecaprenyl-diphosphatase
MFSSIVEGSLRSPWVIAGTTVGFGLLLGVADSRGRRTRDEHSLAITDILWIGLAQALALVPGTSRSGITITAGLLLGLTREAAARFSFLLSIPVIVLAGGLETAQLVQQPDPVAWLDIILGASISAASAYLCIHVFLKLIGRSGMWPFVVYRLVLGAVIVAAFP